MDEVEQEKVVAETKTKGLVLAYSESPGNKKSESRTAILKRRKKRAHRRKLKRSHASG